MPESAAKNADTVSRKKTADIICLFFDLLVLALVIWQAVPALDAYTSDISRTAAAPEEEIVAAAEGEEEAVDENSIFNQIEPESEEHAAILAALAKKWPESKPPYENGYEGLCETWVCEVYQAAGIPVTGSCCAARSRDAFATWSEDIPAGAMIYSGYDYFSGFICEECWMDPGHVAIYIGNGLVAGSQPTYILTLDEFKEYFGYGGWSFGGSNY